MLTAISRECPAFLPYASACYANPASLYATGFQISSEEGEHQGCPCGPLFFAVTALELAKLAHEKSKGWSHWYLDDGYLAGPRATLNDLLPLLEAKAKSIGLVLNRKKCGLMVRDTIPLPDHLFRDIPRINPDQAMAILGAPVGHPDACIAWVTTHVIEPFRTALGRLEGLGEPRAASLILRQCLSACKVAWVLRTADPVIAVWTAQETSPLIRKAWATIVGTNIPDAHWRLTTLPIREGGAGIADPLEIVLAAQVSSWFAAASQPPSMACSAPPPGFKDIISSLAANAPNLGKPLTEALELNGLAAAKQHLLLPQWCSQSAWCDELLRRVIANFDQDVEDRLRNLRKLQLAPNAGLWLTACPHSPNSPFFSPEEWQLLLRTGRACGVTN